MRSLDTHRVGFLLAAWLLLAAHAGSALAAELLPLALPEAINRALERSPGLAVTREDVAVAEARVGQAQVTPPVELGVELENFGGSGELDGTDALETTLLLSRALELGGKRARRIDVAQAGRESALAGLNAARLDVATDVTRKFVDVLGAQEQARAAARFLELAQAIRAQAERRVAAGNALSAELYRAQAEVAREELFRLRSQAELDVTWRALAATWGEPDATRVAAAGDLFRTRPLEPLAALLATLDQTPRLARLATAQRVREAERRLTEAQARPDVEISLGARHLNEAGDTGFVVGASFPFGSRARNRALVVESEASLRQIQAEQTAGRISAVAALSGLHRQVEVRRETLEVLQRDVVPATTAALEQIDRGYRLGRLPYSEYALAAREALDAQLERVRIATEYHQLLADLEGLTGTAVRMAPAP